VICSGWKKKHNAVKEKSMSIPLERITEIEDLRWKGLYIIGGTAALVAVVVFRRFLAVELMAFNGFGVFEMPQTEPVTAFEWFTLLEGNKLLGLILLGIVDLINYALVGLLFLAVYGALRKINKIAMGMAILLSTISLSVYFASNQALSFIHLNQQYQAATNDAQRTVYLSAGEALSANIQGTGWYLSLFHIYLAGLIISLVMRQSNVFNKVTAWTGILANAFGLFLFPTLIFTPTIAWLPPSLSAPSRVTWYVLIAIKLFKTAKGGEDD
jgi:hypothetical protein